MTSQLKKLIEVAMPLESINEASARDSSTLNGHPWNIHYWWARRKLPACRAVLFAQLVDDPSSHPDQFPSEESQATERKRLLDLIEQLVVWENINDESLLSAAREEILKSNGGTYPTIVDPFAGGGSIPLEAQRLGLNVLASDLNPVAVLINKALVEIPNKWIGNSPVFPGASEARIGSWPKATGLATDVKSYGEWLGIEASKKIGAFYPSVKLSDGSEGQAIAWLWARTIKCPNPACEIETPLATTWWLSKKTGQEAWLKPEIKDGVISYKVENSGKRPTDAPKQGRGSNFKCVACGTLVKDTVVKEVALAKKLGSTLLAIVAEGGGRREYIEADEHHRIIAQVQIPQGMPEEELANDPRSIWCVGYGLTKFSDLFTPRQLLAMSTFTDLISEVRAKVKMDASSSGMDEESSSAYGDAVSLYLAFVIDRAADNWSLLTSWHAGNGQIRNVFARQSIPMVWDYAEANPFGRVSVSWTSLLDRYPAAIARLGEGSPANVQQVSAMKVDYSNLLLATDPPYYDNVGYSDLSDFFYVWLRRSLTGSFDSVISTVLTPKADELVASPYRHGGKEAATKHFEDGFVEMFKNVRAEHTIDAPITIFYAFKQSENDDIGLASTGWETLLNGLMSAGWAITATWPIRTERATRSVAMTANTLASSIVLACRPRSSSATATSRRDFIGALRRELPIALHELQQTSIAPVDLAQAAIGPGMSIYSNFSKVLEADGQDMTVRTALALINQVLDEVLSEQEGDFDADTRFCIKWFTQFGWNEAPSSEADVLSRAVNTSITGLERGGIFKAAAGKARLIHPQDMPKSWDPKQDKSISIWEVTLRIAYVLTTGGLDLASDWSTASATRVELSAVKELSYLLYNISEKKGWADAASLFNGLGTSWADLNTKQTLKIDVDEIDFSLPESEGEK